MLSNTITNIRALVRAQLGVNMLEVCRALRLRQVATGQIYVTRP